MAPNYVIASRYGRDAQLETFLMSNVVPQKPELNQGVWRILEERIANVWANKFEELWIITGPIYDPNVEKLITGVEIPDAFFKIVIDVDDNGVRAMAFMLMQGLSRDASFGNYMVAVDEIEKVTGLDFMSELDDVIEDRVEAVVLEKTW